MIAVALCALLLAPLVWVSRVFQAQVNLERQRAADARAQAERARRAQLLADQALADLNAAKARAANHSKTGSQADRATNLWYAINVNHPIFEQGHPNDLTIEFNLVNDGDTAIEPKIADSMIVINGKELPDSGLIFGSGPKVSRMKAPPPGAHLQFNSPLGDQFKQPGIYRVSWKGDGFQTPAITIRILPEATN